ncbi:ROK family protein [Paenibacillus alvei]|uniref:ROK family protein n=1 Tax=Paenibacillus alvei TaxID=44250 RepID=UPI0018CDF15F|nr:ROK family protein [Paenibacillus alvei]MCY9580967.1 ROK family protein [Paenibacillus alvei]MCY9585685.1 ROK family protein [Paenibacillus alvei]
MTLMTLTESEMTKESVVIAIDIGGTNIKSGIVNRQGKVLHSRTLHTEAALGRDELLNKLLRLIALYREDAEENQWMIEGIGVGSAGYIHHDGHVAYATDNLPGWSGTPVQSWLSEATRLPVRVVNDVHAIALGESWKGAGRDLKQFVCVALGTGIGGAIIEQGALYGGADGHAGGFGHFIVQMDGEPCTCGLRGCWEQYASVNALKRMIKEKIQAAEGNPASKLLLPPCEENPKDWFAAARSGNQAANEVITQYIHNIAVGLVALQHVLNCRQFVLGGAITGQGPWMLEAIKAEMRKMCMPAYWGNGVELHAAEMGEHAGVVGAAYYIYTELQERRSSEQHLAFEPKIQTN